MDIKVTHQIARLPRFETKAAEVVPIASTDSTTKLTVESIGNQVYFYADVDTDRCLDLIRQIRDIDNMLRHERVSREIPADHSNVPIWLHINSGGGDAFTGRAVADQLKRIQSPIYSVVEGYCASAATFISMAATRRFILPSSFMLIHEASTFFWGKHSELKDESRLMDMLMEQVVNFYTAHSKMDAEAVREMLRHDYWMDANEALTSGFVDEIMVIE